MTHHSRSRYSRREGKGENGTGCRDSLRLTHVWLLESWTQEGVVFWEPELWFQRLFLLLSCPHSPSPCSPKDGERWRLGGDIWVSGKLRFGLPFLSLLLLCSCPYAPLLFPWPHVSQRAQDSGVSLFLAPDLLGLSMVTLPPAMLASHTVFLYSRYLSW